MKKTLLILFAATALNEAFAADGFSAKFEAGAVSRVCDAVARWQMDNHHLSPHGLLDWTNGALYRGMVEWGRHGGNEACLVFVRQIGERLDWNLLNDRPYHADDICVAQAYIEMYRLYGEREMIQAAEERAGWIVDHPSKAPLRKDDPVGCDERWSWCDALFMAPPVYAAFYTLTGEKRFLEYLNNEYRACVEALYDRDEHLFYRDCIRIPLREPNGAKQLWGRGCGWVFSGRPFIVENLPEDDPARTYFLNLFREMAPSVLRTQDENGAWHSSLLDPKSYPNPENSCSAFFCHGLAWGINNGILDAVTYRNALEKGWKSLLEGVSADGRLGFIQPVGHDPKNTSIETTDVYGVGALLMAGSEIYKLCTAL